MNLEEFGGVADQVVALALQLPRSNVQPLVLVRNPVSDSHVYVGALREQGIRVWAISERAARFAKAVCRALHLSALPVAWLDSHLRHKSLSASRRSVWGILRRCGYAALDIVFVMRLVEARVRFGARVAHFRKPDSWPMLPRVRRLGVRTIYTEDTIVQPPTEHYYKGLGRVERSIDAITAVSSSSAGALRSYFTAPASIRVIPNIVSVPAHWSPEGNQERSSRLACLARLVPEKDLPTLLRAFQLALLRDSTLSLVIHGSGGELNSLMVLAEALNISHHVVFAGAFPRERLAEIMQNIDLVVQSSQYEGFGVALAEGLAYGKPVIATSVGGVPEVIEDGVCGILVPPEDPVSLAEAILTLTGDRELYRRMSEAAQERHRRCFSPTAVVPEYVSLYKELSR